MPKFEAKREILEKFGDLVPSYDTNVDFIHHPGKYSKKKKARD